MENINIKKSLRDIKFETKSELKKAVITDLLSQGNNEEIECYMKDVVQHGCISGMVTSLIYYSDTDAFFKKYFSDIFELWNEYKEEIGETPSIELNANNLSWWAYEYTTYNLLNEIGIEF